MMRNLLFSLFIFCALLSKSITAKKNVIADHSDWFVAILRGPSGAGKSTTSRQLLKEWRESKIPVSYLDWDYTRETMLGLNSVPSVMTVLTSLVEASHGTNSSVLIDGAMWRPDYDVFFESMISKYPGRVFTFYLNVSLEETIRRHLTRKDKEDLNTDQMRSWYLPAQDQVFSFDHVIGESSTLAQSVKFIRNAILI